MQTFTTEQAIRLATLAALEAAGVEWGCQAIAEKVVAHYNDEDGVVRRYVDTGEGDYEAFNVDLG